MEKNLFRSLTVLADGEQVTGFCYAHLTGREALGLLPLPYTLRILNLPDSGLDQKGVPSYWFIIALNHQRVNRPAALL